MKIKWLFFLSIIFVGCSKVEPRRPIDPKPSTTILKETITQSKRLNKIENDKIYIVSLQYNIQDLEGNIIYSEEELGIKTYKVDEEDFIFGLQIGIKLMKIGETITFVIPSYNAFGILGDGKKIGINTSIKSTVTLINIKQ